MSASSCVGLEGKGQVSEGVCMSIWQGLGYLTIYVFGSHSRLSRKGTPLVLSPPWTGQDWICA